MSAFEHCDDFLAARPDIRIAANYERPLNLEGSELTITWRDGSISHYAYVWTYEPEVEG